MKIFLTGATGFSGLHEVKQLSGAGHRLTCLARPASDRSVLEQMGATILVGDVTYRPIGQALENAAVFIG